MQDLEGGLAMMADLSASGVGRYRYTQAKSTPMNDDMQSARATMHCTFFCRFEGWSGRGRGEVIPENLV